MTYKNLPWHDPTAQLYLKFILITQHEVPFINTSEATKKGRMTEQRTANVQMSGTVEVVQACQPHFTLFSRRRFKYIYTRFCHTVAICSL